MPRHNYSDVPLSRFDWKTLPAKPAKREDVLGAMAAMRFALLYKDMSSDPGGTYIACHRSFQFGEWFDFGKMDVDAIVEAAKDAKPFHAEGLLKAPYPICILRARLFGAKDNREFESLFDGLRRGSRNDHHAIQMQRIAQ